MIFRNWGKKDRFRIHLPPEIMGVIRTGSKNHDELP